MNKKFLLLLIAALLLTLPFAPTRARAASGLPDSPQFGYGARVDLQGSNIDAAIQMLDDQQLDWMALDFDWARDWPDPAASPNLGVLEQPVSLATQRGTSVMVSLCNPPQWALSANGPDINKTVEFVSMLAQQYSGRVLVIELFPGANTQHGWGAAPNPEQYLNLLNASRAAVQNMGSAIYIIPSLVPLDPGSSEIGIDDLEFLSTLYALGAKSSLSIVGIRYPETVGTPMTMPAPYERHVLRHYEEVRAVMLQNGHQDGRIWITGFSWAVGNTQHPNIDVLTLTDPAAQAEWLAQAYQLLKAQLYIGAAFFSQANPPPGPDSPSAYPSLLLADSTLHPACQSITRVIQGERISLPPSDMLERLKRQNKDSRMK